MNIIPPESENEGPAILASEGGFDSQHEWFVKPPSLIVALVYLSTLISLVRSSKILQPNQSPIYLCCIEVAISL